MLAERINQDTDAALKAGQSERLGVLRLLKTSLKNEEIKLGHTLNEDEATKIVLREAKQRRDSIEAYTSASRPELAAAEQAELVIIDEYLPKQMDEAELRQLIEAAMTTAGVGAQMGQIIGAVKAKAGNSADGALIAKLVRERLGQ